jgi:tetrahydromethanopterin S-methyltransferase subunit C
MTPTIDIPAIIQNINYPSPSMKTKLDICFFTGCFISGVIGGVIGKTISLKLRKAILDPKGTIEEKFISKTSLPITTAMFLLQMSPIYLVYYPGIFLLFQSKSFTKLPNAKAIPVFFAYGLISGIVSSIIGEIVDVIGQRVVIKLKKSAKNPIGETPLAFNRLR